MGGAGTEGNLALGRGLPEGADRSWLVFRRFDGVSGTTKSSSTSIASASSSSSLEVREDCEAALPEGPPVGVVGVATVVFFGVSFEGSSRSGACLVLKRGVGDGTGNVPFVGDAWTLEDARRGVSSSSMVV